MVDSIGSGAAAGLFDNIRRFDRSTATVSRAAQSLAAAAPDGQGAPALSDAMVQMANAKFAMMASLKAAEASNEMVAQTLKIGGYVS